MGIPEYPNGCELTLEHREALQRAFRAAGPEISEFAFANVYLFRRAHQYRLSVLGDFLVLTARGYDGKVYAFPPLGSGSAREASLRLCDRLAAEGGEPLLFPVPRSLLEAQYSDGRWVVEADRDQADYVYSREDLAALPGKKFHKRRNRLLKFIREEAAGYGYAPLSDEHVSECLALADEWCGVRCSVSRPSTYLETDAAREALRERAPLGLTGGVVTISGRVAAFTLGEELNPEVFVVHFEKSRAGHEGLAQLINRDFCVEALSGYRYVNREQDLGDPGLRQAKEQYNPVCMAEKFRVRPR